MRPLREAPELIGRASELEVLQAFLDNILDAAHALVLEGDPGIGKSTVWAKGVQLAEERGYTVLVSRTTQAERQLPFVALADLFERVSENTLEGLPEPQRRALEVAMLKTASDGTPIERRTVAMGVLGVVRALAEAVPVVLGVDDIQWLDPASAAALEFALRRLDDDRVGVLATRRTREQPVGPAVAIPLERLRVLEVRPLDRRSLDQLVLERLQLPLAPPTLHRLYRVSGGNPFFALELARALQRRGERLSPGEPLPVPRDLRELVRDRLRDLPRAAQEVALVVSALSQPTFDRVEAALEPIEREGDGIERALAAGVVEVERDRLRFTHPLLGSVVYSDTAPARRRELHARLAAAVQDPDDHARHLALAATGPDPEVARALDEAAARALQRGAPETAAELLEHARRLTPQDDAENRWRRGFRAADCHLKAGDAETAESMLRDLVDDTPPGRWRARALTHLAGALSLQENWKTLADLAARALLETDELETRVACEEMLAWATWFRGDIRAAVPHIRAFVALAEEEGDRVRLAEALGAQAFLEGIHGERRTDAILERALEVADEQASVRMLRQPHRWWTPLLMWADELEAASRVAYAEHVKALDSGDEHVLANVLDGLTDVERLKGNFDTALRFADEMHRAALLTGQDLIRAIALSKQALALALLGRDEEARAKASEGIALANRIGFLQPKLGCLHALGVVELAHSRYAEAKAFLDEAVAEAEGAGIREPGLLRFVPDAVEALALLGQTEAAASTLEPFEERASALERRWASAAAARCRALLADLEQGPVAALSLVREAACQQEELSQPYELARTLLVEGIIQRRAKQKAVARGTLERAGTIFAELGATSWHDRTARELARIGGRSPRRGGLTETERRIAELAAAGQTNREIASALFLSPNTVQAYLKRIYRELGVRSRTELARKLPPLERSKSTDSGVSAAERPS